MARGIQPMYFPVVRGCSRVHADLLKMYSRDGYSKCSVVDRNCILSLCVRVGFVAGQFGNATPAEDLHSSAPSQGSETFSL